METQILLQAGEIMKINTIQAAVTDTQKTVILKQTQLKIYLLKMGI